MHPLAERTLSYLFKNARGRDAKLFTRGPAFADHPAPTIAISSPDYGGPGSGPGPGDPTATPVPLREEHSADGAGAFPALEWAPAGPAGVGADRVREWVLVVEDADAPLPAPIVHGLYTGITPTKTTLTQTDLAVADASQHLLAGGFHHGQAWRGGAVYIPPRPLLNHGPHRYFYQVVALSEPLPQELVRSAPAREAVAAAVVGKVLGWGAWVGVYERKWTK